ncbi:hypothetical protein [Streptomyces sp. 8P21H-1]|uniref:hypothetical protein n=1 Tax=Streptomyces sp. 8P21H-1 TaxID=2737048 RepID=UPI00156E3537|nr:hypothetical protein [Streptomyces sp. 8P21H-1]NSL42713.1 hypothetical protein [Streptomyces sp. 8P21H-1]
MYLYQSDVWVNAKANEALAKHYWQPLVFNSDGSIRPIECGWSYDVTVPVRPGSAPKRPHAVETGDAGYRTHWDVAGELERAQEVTMPGAGRLRAVRFTTFQSGYPNAPLVLDLRRTAADGVGSTVGSVKIPADEVSWAARWAQLKLDRPLQVHAGDRFALVVRSATTQGAYGIAHSDTTAYGEGRALISHDGGEKWTTEPGRVLHVEADVS